MTLTDHLVAWLGAWPPRAPVDVVASEVRTRPAWDGQPRRVLGVGSPELGVLLSVRPDLAEVAREAVAGNGLDQAARSRLAIALGGGVISDGVFRWAHDVPGPDVLPDVGTWLDRDDERVPEWLRPFNGGVLVALDTDGRYAAGVGVKRHDDVGHELSVGTDPDHRGQGLARRLVAQASRTLLAAGAVVTYLHGRDNVASARVADAAGFPDLGWTIHGLFPDGPDR